MGPDRLDLTIRLDMTAICAWGPSHRNRLRFGGRPAPPHYIPANLRMTFAVRTRYAHRSRPQTPRRGPTRIRYTIPRSGDPSARRGCLSEFNCATSVRQQAPQEEANVEAG